AQLFLDNEHNPAFDDFGLVFTTDEEVGGFKGVGKLIEAGLKADTVLNPDGAYPFTPSLSEKGIVHMRIDASGKAAHGSRPWQGENAINNLIEDLKRIEGLYDFADAANMWTVSMNIGRIEGGKSTNSVPESASAYVDFRLPPEVDPEELKLRVAGALQNSVSTVLIEGDAVSIDENSPALKNLQRALSEHGYDHPPLREHGGSDARWFTKQGSEILLIKPEGSEGHVSEEWVSLSGLADFYDVIDSFVKLQSKKQN
ncbi:MAG: M20/M25/M40 family metallo-hydrolase, partial [Bdellovibrionales bacterium]|nr:M20/M25/M40 family metallo-hydrolase [Bdellovibrionales bacterium]